MKSLLAAFFTWLLLIACAGAMAEDVLRAGF
jgi:hypothetical protein